MSGPGAVAGVPPAGRIFGRLLRPRLRLLMLLIVLAAVVLAWLAIVTRMSEQQTTNWYRDWLAVNYPRLKRNLDARLERAKTSGNAAEITESDSQLQILEGHRKTIPQNLQREEARPFWERMGQGLMRFFRR